MRNPFRRKGHAGLDGSALHGRHAANPATEGYAPRSRFRTGEHRRQAGNDQSLRDRIARGAVPPEPPKVVPARPIRKVPGSSARQASDGVARARGRIDRVKRDEMRRQGRGDS